MLSPLWTISADNFFFIFSSQQNLTFHANYLHWRQFFSSQKNLTFHANYLQWRQFAWNVKFCSLGKNKKNISKFFCWKVMLLKALWVKNSTYNTLKYFLIFPRKQKPVFEKYIMNMSSVELAQRVIRVKVHWYSWNTLKGVQHWQSF